LVELLLFGESPPAGADAVIKKLLASETMYTDSNAQVLSLVDRVKSEPLQIEVCILIYRQSLGYQSNEPKLQQSSLKTPQQIIPSSITTPAVMSPIDPEERVQSAQTFVAERLQRIRLAREKFRNGKPNA